MLPGKAASLEAPPRLPRASPRWPAPEGHVEPSGHLPNGDRQREGLHRHPRLLLAGLHGALHERPGLF